MKARENIEHSNNIGTGINGTKFNKESSISLSFRDTVRTVTVSSGTTKESFTELCDSAIPGFDSSKEAILGLKQGKSVYPLQLVSYNPSFFSEGNFDLVTASTQSAPPRDTQDGSTMNGLAAQEPPLAFWLSSAQRVRVTVSYHDVGRLKRLSSGASLLRTDPSDVYNVLNTVAIDGLVDDDQYAKFCDLIVSRVDAQEADFVRDMLNTLFKAFDRTGNALVDLDELASGFSLMTKGSKSDKLALAFDVFDADNDGLLSRRELWKFLRAFLSVILEFSDAKASLGGVDALHNAVDDAAVEMVANIFKTCELSSVQKISFEDFGFWYNADGHSLMPWLELLDMKKWPDNPGDESQPEDESQTEDESQPEDESTDRGDETDEYYPEDDGEYSLDSSTVSTTPSMMPIYEFNLAGNVGLRICPRDIENLNSLLELTGLHGLSPQNIHDAVTEMAGSGRRMSKAEFDAMIRELKPGDDMSKEEKTFLSFAFSSYFFAFDRHGEESVDTIDFANGFTVLAGGSKSEKLALAFQHLDHDGEGFVSKRELWRFLRSFLTMLAALTEQMSTAPSGSVAAVIHNACIAATETIFENARLSKASEGVISFEEFADWYTNGGFQHIPWLELLDLKKWPYDDDEEEGEEETEDAGEEEDEDEDDYEEEDVEEEEEADASTSARAAPEAAPTPSSGHAAWVSPVFEFILNSTNEKLVYYPQHVESLRRFIRLTEIGDMDPTEILMALSMDNKDGRVDGNGFLAAMHDAVELGGLTEEDVDFVSSLLAKVYDAFSYFAEQDDNADDVAVKDLVGALTVFTEGSKSEKLGHIFDLFCDAGKETMPRTSLFEYLRAFLMVLTCLSNMASKSSFPYAADQGASEIAATIFDQLGKDGSSDEISFSEFAEWYSSGGFQMAPWLELLDLRKWPGPTFEFVLTDNGDSLCIFPQDIEYFGSVLALTNLDGQDAGSIGKALREQVDPSSPSGQYVSKKEFDACVRALVPGHTLSDQEKAFLSYALSKIFFAFGKDNQKAALDELTCGMVLLGHGSKSDKLSLAFSAMETKGDGTLTKRDVWRYLRSFLTVLFALSSNESGTHGRVSTVLHNASVEMTEKMFEQADLEVEGVMRFEEFADWYTYGGFELIPWLELLDLKKWPQMLPFAPVVPSPKGAQVDAASVTSTNDSEANESESVSSSVVSALSSSSSLESPNLLSFRLGGDKALDIFSKDVERLQLVLDLTNFDTMACSELTNEFYSMMSEDGLLTKAMFDQAIVNMVDGDTLDQEEKVFLSVVLSKIFFAFARGGEDAAVVDAVDFSSGFTVLARGSKSEKLALAFQRLRADAEGNVSKREMWRFLRSFLTMLAALTEQRSTSGEGTDAMIQNACTSATESIFEDPDRSATGMISFEEFADWYTNGGFQHIPWLELLDLKKWPYDEEEAAEEEERETGDEGAETLFEFVLNSDGDVLSFDGDDAERLLSLGALTGLDVVAPKAPIGALLELAGGDPDARIELEEFCTCLMNNGDPAPFLEIYESLSLFSDEDGGQGRPVKELIGVVSVFTQGSKSEKLGHVFDLFCDAGKETMSMDGTYRFLRALIVALASLSSAMLRRSEEAVSLTLDQAAVELTQRIFRESEKEESLLLTFSDFADWYTEGGYHVAPWLELLDRKKWPEA
jgi:Ca2+-binding EF-hand superfamily protein